MLPFRTDAHRDLAVLFGAAATVGAQRPAWTPRFSSAVLLETTSEDSANVSMGDLDGDGDLDVVLAKGRHTPLVDRILLNDGRGHFIASSCRRGKG